MTTTQIGPDGKRYNIGSIPALTRQERVKQEVRVKGVPQAGYVPTWQDDGSVEWEPVSGDGDTGGVSTGFEVAYFYQTKTFGGGSGDSFDNFEKWFGDETDQELTSLPWVELGDTNRIEITQSGVYFVQATMTAQLSGSGGYGFSLAGTAIGTQELYADGRPAIQMILTAYLPVSEAALPLEMIFTAGRTQGSGSLAYSTSQPQQLNVQINKVQ